MVLYGEGERKKIGSKRIIEFERAFIEISHTIMKSFNYSLLSVDRNYINK